MMFQGPPPYPRKIPTAPKMERLSAPVRWMCKARVNWQCESKHWIDAQDIRLFHGAKPNHASVKEWAHVLSRVYKSLMWHPLGALCLCHDCHKLFTQNPLLWSEFMSWYYGPDVYESIKREGQTITKWTNADKREMLKYYHKELEAMKNKILDGVPFPLEFQSFDPYDIISIKYDHIGETYGIQRCKIFNRPNDCNL